MKHVRGGIGIIAGLLVVMTGGGTAAAASESVTHELHVTAIVPHRRQVVVDMSGRILEITSNTSRDVKPEVYVLRAEPANRRQMTGELYREYRRHVPEGADGRGILYRSGGDRPAVATAGSHELPLRLFSVRLQRS